MLENHHRLGEETYPVYLPLHTPGENEARPPNAAWPQSLPDLHATGFRSDSPHLTGPDEQADLTRSVLLADASHTFLYCQYK